MSTIVHFDVSAEDTKRAKAFYASRSDWKFQAFPEMEYNLITTTNLDGSLPGPAPG
jgi:predicted enzyme related to lactoylglutathione lyase